MTAHSVQCVFAKEFTIRALWELDFVEVEQTKAILVVIADFIHSILNLIFFFLMPIVNMRIHFKHDRSNKLLVQNPVGMLKKSSAT